MFKNYLKIAFRNIIKQKLHSIITIVGLAVGITCCLLIMLYVKQELSYDTFYPNADNIYRIGHKIIRPARTGISVRAFALGAVFSLAVASITVGYQSIKSALTNPVDSLRYE